MNPEQERIRNPLMEYYRHVYSFSTRWDGNASLEDKTVIVYCEQGYGDCIQFLRYIKTLKITGCKVILHCSQALFPLLNYVEGVDEFFDKNISILPKHDYHILSLSLPFLLGEFGDDSPYIHYPDTADLSEYPGRKIGIAWEGSPDHPKNADRCCPLKHFKALIKPDTKLFMLQNQINDLTLVQDVDFDLYSILINTFGDTASLINAVDFVVTVDTAVLHLAGAMGKRTYGIIPFDADPRWKAKSWYQNTILLKGDWESSFFILENCK